MGRKKGFVPYNKIVWTDEMDQYIFNNWDNKTNKQIAEGLGLKLTVVRTRIYSLGLKRMELEYWTPSQVLFLMENYKEMGDTEIAEIFSQEWPEKKKGWSKKHISLSRKR